jgi:hypothetical protein
VAATVHIISRRITSFLVCLTWRDPPRHPPSGAQAITRRIEGLN